MALSPLDRPAESTQVLRYRGTVAVGQSNANVYPQTAGVIPANSTITGTYFDAYVRFPLFKPGQVGSGDFRHQLLPFVYDDGQPAEDAPHTPVACVASATPGVNTTDLSMNQQTWAQNLEITVREIPTALPLVLSADSGVSQDSDPANGAIVVLDNATSSGMGLGTGLPVLLLHFRVLADDGALQAFNVDVTIEVRHSNHR